MKVSFLVIHLLITFAASLFSSTHIPPLEHPKPWTGVSQIAGGKSLKLKGTTGWRTSGNNSIYELIITLKSDNDWTSEDAPEWFVAIPSDTDDPQGTRDYIIIKSSYDHANTTQTVQYFRSVDPTFEVVKSDFSFTDSPNSGIFSTQIAQKDPPKYLATGGTEATVWAVTNAAFSENSVSLLF